MLASRSIFSHSFTIPWLFTKIVLFISSRGTSQTNSKEMELYKNTPIVHNSISIICL